MDCINFDFNNRCWPWYSRVPTEANIADAPSRLVVGQDLLAFKAQAVRPNFPAPFQPVCWLMGDGGLAYNSPVP